MFLCFSQLNNTSSPFLSSFPFVLLFFYQGSLHRSAGCCQMCGEGTIHKTEIHGSVAAELLQDHCSLPAGAQWETPGLRYLWGRDPRDNRDHSDCRYSLIPTSTTHAHSSLQYNNQQIGDPDLCSINLSTKKWRAFIAISWHFILSINPKTYLIANKDNDYLHPSSWLLYSSSVYSKMMNNLLLKWQQVMSSVMCGTPTLRHKRAHPQISQSICSTPLNRLLQRAGCQNETLAACAFPPRSQYDILSSLRCHSAPTCF